MLFLLFGNDFGVVAAVLAVIAILVIRWFVKTSLNDDRKKVEQEQVLKIAKQQEREAKAKTTVFTKEEVAKHNTEHDCWLIIDNKVYDVSDYVDVHPGGPAILNNAGGDSSKGFHGEQHPDNVLTLLPDYYIGNLCEDEETTKESQSRG